MASVEIDSFIYKFKYLWETGRNASLNLEAKDGKTIVSLSVEFEDPPNDDLPEGWNHSPGSRHGPAQQRRRVKRAAAREAAVAAKATTENKFAAEANDEIEVKDIIEKANVNESKPSVNKRDKFEDELCSEEEYIKHVEEDSEIFKITSKIFPDEIESQVLDKIKTDLYSTFNYLKVKKEDRKFTIIKSKQFKDCLKLLLKVKRIPKVLESVNGLKTWKTDVSQLPEKITVPPSTSSP